MLASGFDGSDRGRMGRLEEDQGINGMPATLPVSLQSSANNLPALTLGHRRTRPRAEPCEESRTFFSTAYHPTETYSAHIHIHSHSKSKIYSHTIIKHTELFTDFPQQLKAAGQK